MWLKLATINSLIQKIQSEANRMAQMFVDQLKNKSSKRGSFWWEKSFTIVVRPRIQSWPQIFFQVSMANSKSMLFHIFGGLFYDEMNIIQIPIRLNITMFQPFPSPEDESKLKNEIFSILVHELRHFIQQSKGTLKHEDYERSDVSPGYPPAVRLVDSGLEFLRLRRAIGHSFNYWMLNNEIEAEASTIYSKHRKQGMTIRNAISLSVDGATEKLYSIVENHPHLNITHKQELLQLIGDKKKEFEQFLISQLMKDFPLIKTHNELGDLK